MSAQGPFPRVGWVSPIPSLDGHTGPPATQPSWLQDPVSGAIKDCVHLDCFLRKRDSFKHSSTLFLPGETALPYSPDSSPRAYLTFIYSIGAVLGAGDTAVERQGWLLLAVKQEPLTKRHCNIQ